LATGDCRVAFAALHDAAQHPPTNDAQFSSRLAASRAAYEQAHCPDSI
jgi:hypothetical protein